jgi:ribosomal protein S27E
MRATNLIGLEHPVFKFLAPTLKRINNSVAWRVECKNCGHEQLVGAAQAKRGSHNSCINCQLTVELNKRTL